MKGKRIYLFFVLFWLLISLSGCLYLRLQTLKTQLSQFDTYFLVREENDGFTLIAKSPILYSSDMLRLIGMDPTSKEQGSESNLWRYVFQKECSGPKVEDGDFDITVGMLFQDDKLAEVRFSRRFLSILPKPFLVGIFRAMGQATVNIRKRSVRIPSWSSGKSEEPFQIPNRQDIISLLGSPFSVQNSESGYEITYNYHMKTNGVNIEPSKTKVWVKFLFGRDERLLRSQADFVGMQIIQDYETKVVE